MSDLAERVHAIGERVDAGYHAAKTESALANLRTKLQRRRATRLVVGGAMTALGLAAGVFWAVGTHRGHPTPASHGEALFTLGDGSVVTPLDSASRVVAKTVSERQVELELLSGSASFDVAPNRERSFRVDAGRVAITVLGTKFRVERQGDHTVVAVQAGKVRVSWERGEQLLDPGERGVFPPFDIAAAEPTEPDGPSGSPNTQPQGASMRRGGDSRSPAEHGHGADRSPADKARADGLANVDELLLAADSARTSGHAADSVRYLERALALRPDDGRSAVVAFTLGRVLLADVHDPARAADAFARARAFAPHGPLAEDALAREIEARHRAGDEARARALAAEYLETWPSGSRVRAVRHFGGLPR